MRWGPEVAVALGLWGRDPAPGAADQACVAVLSGVPGPYSLGTSSPRPTPVTTTEHVLGHRLASLGWGEGVQAHPW